MLDIRIKIIPGNYTNLDAFYNVINYISSKDIIGGYGFWGNSPKSVAEQFLNCVKYSCEVVNKELWHFVISSHAFSNPYETFRLGNEIAKIIKDHYQIIFAYDNETRNPHLHFAVNSYSYLPNHPVLTQEIFSEFLNQVKILLYKIYPSLPVHIDFKEEREENHV